MNESVPICSISVNRTCWEEHINAMNSAYATLMIPVEIMMATFMVIGVFGNTLVLIVYIFKSNKKSAHLFIMHLACIDLVACAILHPYIIYKIFHYYDQTWVAACKVFEFFVHLNLFASATTLLTVAIDRYLAICKPICYIRFFTHVIKLIVATVIISVGVSLPLLEFYGTRATIYELDHLMIISYRCDYSEKHRSTSMMTFSVFIMLLFLVEVTAMSVLYKNVAVVAYKARRSVGPLSHAHILAGFKSTSTEIETFTRNKQLGSNCVSPKPHKTDSSIYSITTTENQATLKTNKTLLDEHNSGVNASEIDHLKSSKAHSSLRKNEFKRINTDALFCVDNQDKVNNRPIQMSNTVIKNRTLVKNPKQTAKASFASQLKAAKILFSVTAIFFLSWMPFFILRICYTLNSDYWERDTRIEIVTENLINHFFYINNAINPIVYTLINKNFRQDCMNILKKHFCKRNRRV